MSEQSHHLVPSLDTQKFILKDNEYWLPAEDIGKALGYAEPAKAIFKIYERNKEQFKNFSVTVKLTATDGKAYEKRIFSEEGIYLLAIYANTPTAKAFQVEVARFLKRERLRRMQNIATGAKYEAAVLVKEIYSRYPAKKVEKVLRCKQAGFTVADAALVAGVSKRAAGKIVKLAAKIPISALLAPKEQPLKDADNIAKGVMDAIFLKGGIQ